MLPRWHILFGAIFALLILIVAPKTKFIFVFLVFLSAVLIDFDHYTCAVLKTKKFGLFHAFEYHRRLDEEERFRKKQGIKQRGDLHLFHTIEFHILVGMLGLIWIGFFYVFLGMIFHSLLDIYSLLFIGKEMYRREFFLVGWVWRKLKR